MTITKILTSRWRTKPQVTLWLAAALAFFLSLPTQAGPTAIDIYGGLDSGDPTNLTVFNNKLYFAGTNNSNGTELWVNDGTVSGTTLLKDINLGMGDSNPFNLTVVNEKLYFLANDGSSGVELWVSDGTEGGTRRVKDIRLGPDGSIYNGIYRDPNGLLSNGFFSEFVVFNNKLYFQANDGSSGVELWVSDGTEGGTTQVKDFAIGSGNGFPNKFTVFNNKLYFSAKNTRGGYELWVSDGTDAGTTQITNTAYGITPKNLTVYNNKLYFSAVPGTGISDDRELWVSDGTDTASGITRVADICPGSDGSYPTNLTVYNDKLYFQAAAYGGDAELWVSDGTEGGTKQMMEINIGSSGSYPSNFTVFNDKLYFSANSTPFGIELWVSDGTWGGTRQVKDINRTGTDDRNSSLDPNSHPSNFTVFNNKLYFSATDGSSGIELWVSNGTEDGTRQVKDIYAGSGSSNPKNLTVFNNKLYLSATDGGYNGVGNELWVLEPLQLTAQAPANATRGVAVNTTSLSLTYDEGIIVGTGNIVVHKASDNNQVDSIDVATSGVTINENTATISLLADVLSPNTEYYVTVAEGAFTGVGSGTSVGVSGTSAWTFTTGKASQVITIAGDIPTIKSVGDAAFIVTATGGASGNSVVLGSSDPSICTVSGNSVTPVAEGTCTLTANQTGNADYNAAEQVTKDITVAKATQTLTFDPATPTSKTLGDEAFNVTVTGGASGNPLVLGSSTTGVCTVSGKTVTLVAAGACALTIDQAGNSDYAPATQVTKVITVAKRRQTLAFDATTPASKILGDAVFSVTAISTSGLAVTLGSSTPNVCTVSGTTVTLLAVGTCTLIADQAGNTSYNAAPQVTKDITVTPPTQGNGNTTATVSSGNVLDFREENISSYTTGMPSGMEFNLGLYSYRVVDLSTTTPETINVTLTFADPIPTGAKLYKVSNTGYTEITGVTISGNTATFAMTDGGSFDADGIFNGTIVDPVALGLPPNGNAGGTASSGGGGSFGWAELLFAVSIFGAALRRRLAFGN